MARELQGTWAEEAGEQGKTNAVLRKLGRSQHLAVTGCPRATLCW